jgi:hypothetical protein
MPTFFKNQIVKILFIILTIILGSCHKELIQRCSAVYDLKETYQWFGTGYIKTDTIWPQSKSVSPIVCDSMLAFWKSVPEKWVRICDADGSTKYYERFIVDIKN